MSKGYDDSNSDPINFTSALRFNPPDRNDTLEDLFSLSDNNSMRVSRSFIRNSNEHQILVYIAGACVNDGNSLKAGVGGCTIIFKSRDSPESIENRITSFHLEDHGPSGVFHPHTSDCVELHAIIAVL